MAHINVSHASVGRPTLFFNIGRGLGLSVVSLSLRKRSNEIRFEIILFLSNAASLNPSTDFH